MPITIGSNIASLKTQRRLAAATDALSSTYERLSSGQRINKASDDAAGLAIASTLNAKSRIFHQAIRNINDGVSATNIVVGAVENLQSVLSRLEELATQAENGTFSFKQRASIDKEAQALRKEYNRIVQSTTFNGQNLFTRDASIQIQAGEGTQGILSVGFSSTTSTEGGSGNFYSIQQYYPVADGSSNRTPHLLGDLNGDGYDDIVLLTAADDKVSILLNNGDGTFRQGASYASYFLHEAGALGDVNNDGNLDVTYAWFDGGAVGTTVRYGTGQGTFGDEQRASGGIAGLPSYLALADVNGDGNLDALTVANAFTNAAGVALGRGDGTFGNVTLIADVADAQFGIQVGDINGDGALDFISGQAGNNTVGFSLYLNNGSGGFTRSSVNVGAASNGINIANLGDINSDGTLDVVFMDRAIGGVYVALGNGNGTFTATYSISSTLYGDNYPSLTDINGDGALDIVGDVNNWGIIYNLGDGRGSFGASVSTLENGGFNSSGAVLLSDLNRDGTMDVVRGVNGDGLRVYLQEKANVQSRAEVRSLAEFSMKTRSDAYKAFKIINDTRIRLSAVTATMGASQSRLQTAANTLNVTRENYISASSRITDADVAQESANLVRQQILQQAASAVLTQANQAPNLALKLLQGE